MIGGGIVSRLGEIKNNSKGTLMKIIGYRNNNDVDVEFLDDFHYVKEHQTYSNFSHGTIKNPYDKTMCGIGYIGVGKHMARNSDTHKLERIYQIWAALFDRCYHNKEKYPAYYDKCEICEEWHNYQNFADWYEKNEYECDGRLHIDKDILNPNCNIYSPENCLLVPQRINMLFMNRPNKRGLPNGIIERPNGYLARYSGKDYGVHKTLNEAYLRYAAEKESAIKNIADEYKDIIPQKVYEALYNYKVDIRNDKNYII